MKNFYRVMAGKSSVHAEACRTGGFIGADFDIHEDLTDSLPDEWRLFNKQYIPVFQANVPGKSRIAAGLACGALWTISKGIRPGDIVLTPDGNGAYLVGDVTGEYFYAPGEILPHRRQVTWREDRVPRTSMSEALKRAAGSIGTVSNVSGHVTELDAILGHRSEPLLVATDPEVENPLAFAMEKHLEDFLVANWGQTNLAKDWIIVSEDGELIGQQYVTGAGTIDILAQSRDGSRLLIVELKRGRASDVVVGQVLRYMGCVKDEIAELGQSVEGAIIALEDDKKLKWALSAVPGVRFLRYQVSFQLVEA